MSCQKNNLCWEGTTTYSLDSGRVLPDSKLNQPQSIAATLHSPSLFHFDGRASLSELLLNGLRLFLGDVLFDRLRSAINQVFGFLETQAGDFPDGLDHVDLVGARRGQDHGELGFLGLRARSRTSTTAGDDYRTSRCRR